MLRYSIAARKGDLGRPAFCKGPGDQHVRKRAIFARPARATKPATQLCAGVGTSIPLRAASLINQ